MIREVNHPLVVVDRQQTHLSSVNCLTAQAAQGEQQQQLTTLTSPCQDRKLLRKLRTSLLLCLRVSGRGGVTLTLTLTVVPPVMVCLQLLTARHRDDRASNVNT